MGKSTTLRLRRSAHTVPRRAGIVVGQRPQHHRIDHAEDRRGGADAERDGQDGGDGKGRLALQAAKREMTSRMTDSMRSPAIP